MYFHILILQKVIKKIIICFNNWLISFLLFLCFSQRSSAPFQVLDRDSLLNRDRTLDTSKWDDTPDDLIGIDPDPEDGQDPEGGPAPAVVDSSFIDSLRREAEKAETADEEDDPS